MLYLSTVKARRALLPRRVTGAPMVMWPRMLEWVLIGAAAAVGGGFVAYKVGRSRGAARALPARSAGKSAGGSLLERTIKDVRVDDVVQHVGRDWLVEGIVQYDEDGHTWRGARVIDGAEERWFVVGLERTGGTTLRLLQVAAGLELTGYPPETLEHGGTTFKLAQRGTATAVLSGQLGSLPGAKGIAAGGSTRCRWWRYQAAGEKTLVVEQWGEVYRALAGDLVPMDEIDLLTAS